MGHKLLENIEEMITLAPLFPDPTRLHISEMVMQSEANASRLVTEGLLKRFGDELFPDETRYIHGPVGMSANGGEVICQTYRFKAEYRPFDDLMEGAEEEDILDIVCGQMCEELWDQMENLALKGSVMYPYRPVIAIQKIDPLTMLPYMIFTSRFGVGAP
jgi:hypothetical protein